MLPATAKDPGPIFIVPEANCLCFSLDAIHLATQNFNDDLVIGRGGFGTVYKGETDHGSAAVVAIKRMHSHSDQGLPEFRAEVEMLSKMRHSHLVSLIGYCKEGQEMALVYEYMPQGTLEDHLYKGGARLSWVQLLRICIGAARGLDYLHTGTGTQHGIIHRDVKTSNILLDKNFEAKISDFGLAKICPTNQSHTYVSTLVKGTFGYMDPCYFNTGKLTRKSDVYAYGVLLLEVICGRPAVDTTLDEDQWSLAQWAQDRIKQGKLNQIIDSNLRGQISSQCLKDFVRIACRCLHNQPNRRPTMAEIVSTLEATLSLQERLHFSVIQGNVIDKVLGFITAKSELKNDNFISIHPLGSEGEPSNKAGKALIPQSPLVWDKTKSFQPVNLKSFSFEVIKAATRNFRPPAVLGEHVYSSLHKGWLDEQYEPARPGTGIPIAVKILKASLQGHQEWFDEITYLGILDHPNIVNLIGYCVEEDHRMLVCEFMSRGNLGKYLFRKSSHTRPLSWNLRIKVALGVAKGLAYLHSPEAKQRYHHDFKSCSILLDMDYNAKLCLLWLAKDGPVDGNSRVSSRVMGTSGYTAPNSNATGDLVKNNTYAFGVVLLEILTGRRCIDKKLPPSEQVLVEFVMSCLKNKRRILEVIDPKMDGQYSSSVGARAQLAMKCVSEEPMHRPTAYELVKVLEELQDSQISAENSVRMSCIN